MAIPRVSEAAREERVIRTIDSADIRGVEIPVLRKAAIIGHELSKGKWTVPR
jgi:hypothetical protein